MLKINTCAKVQLLILITHTFFNFFFTKFKKLSMKTKKAPTKLGELLDG